jgi:hypothetical protein
MPSSRTVHVIPVLLSAPTHVGGYTRGCTQASQTARCVGPTHRCIGTAPVTAPLSTPARARPPAVGSRMPRADNRRPGLTAPRPVPRAARPRGLPPPAPPVRQRPAAETTQAAPAARRAGAARRAVLACLTTSGSLRGVLVTNTATRAERWSGARLTVDLPAHAICCREWGSARRHQPLPANPSSGPGWLWPHARLAAVLVRHAFPTQALAGDGPAGHAVTGPRSQMGRSVLVRPCRSVQLGL